MKTLATGAIRAVDKSEGGVAGQRRRLRRRVPGASGGSPTGHELLFTTYATNLIDGGPLNGSVAPFLMAKDIDDNTVGFIAAGVTDASWAPNGTWLAFSSRYVNGCEASLLRPPLNGSSQVFAWQVATAELRADQRQRGRDARPPTGPARWTRGTRSWSPDSTRVAFMSWSHELVPGDTNGSRDIFVKNVQTGAIDRVSVSATGAQANNYSEYPAFAPTGNRLVFNSAATNLVVGDNNSAQDVFVKDLSTGAVTAVSVKPSGEFVFGTNGSRMAELVARRHQDPLRVACRSSSSPTSTRTSSTTST